MTALTKAQITALTSIVTGFDAKRSATKEAAIKRFTAAVGDADRASRILASDTFEEAEAKIEFEGCEAEEIPADDCAVDGDFDDQAPAAEDLPPATDEELEAMDVYGRGSNEANAACPHCGVNHMANGAVQNVDLPDPATMARKHMCLGCGGEWGPKIPGRRAKGKRASSLSGRHFKVVNGEMAANPWRENTLSHAAFNLVQDNAGISFEQFVEAGGRVRTLQEDIKKGRIREVKVK